MLKKIRKIKGCGVFADFTASADLPNFGRYNIIYGENGSGKTTLSRLFSSLEAGENPDYPNLEYSIESDDGQTANGLGYARKVRVFNSDYVEANIGKLEGPLKHILILGEENRTLAEQLKNDVASREDRLRSIEDCNTQITKLETDKGKIFSQIAKVIGEATSGSTLRSYRKPDAELAFSKLPRVALLSENDLENHRATVRQEQMEAIGPLNPPRVVHESTEGSVLDLAKSAAMRAKLLTIRSAQSSVIERLVENPTISAWVEEGVSIHASHSSDMCEFCGRPMPEDRLKALAKHFSVEDQRLKEEITSERHLLEAIIQALDGFTIPDRLAVYSELRSEYDIAITRFWEEVSRLKKRLRDVDEVLAEKQTLRTTSYEPDIQSETETLETALEVVRAVVNRHDEKTARFTEEKAEARDRIESHYLLTIEDQVNEVSAKIVELQIAASQFRNGDEKIGDKRSLNELSQSIAEKQAKVSDAHAGGADLTRHLEQFLGRTDLKFESGEDGYRVLRQGKPAKRLSEGEKTAVAFLYFLVQLKDRDFNLEEGVVVIDDPISSLDASAIYQAFSFLKNEAQPAKQLFVFTHNFEFLKLLINWVKNIPRLGKDDKTYTMVLCAETERGRAARLAPLDRLLIEHATEYHYLFKVLYNFKSDGTILGCYHVPNIARKVLETFLDFHIPSNKSLYQKLEETNFDPHKKTAIYKFSNDLSHHTGKGFDPALVAEAQKNTAYLLEMIAAVEPLHYQGLKALSEAGLRESEF